MQEYHTDSILFSHLGGLIPYFPTGGRIYPDETDLDTITTYGMYSGANAKKLINSPSDAPEKLFNLIVNGYDGDKRIVQTLICPSGYIRTRAYTTTLEGVKWTDWG